MDEQHYKYLKVPEVAEKLAKTLSNRADSLNFDAKNLTLGKYLRLWLKESVQDTVRLTTFQGYERNVRLHIKPALGRIKLDKLTPVHVRSLYREKLEAGLAPRMCNWSILPSIRR